MVNDPVAVALSVAAILEECGLRYLVGGSLASSLSGEPRSTLDIVVGMTTSDEARLVEALRGEFDVDDRAVARAVRDRSSVNIFHRASAIKVDLFVMGGSPLDDEQMNRWQRVQVTAGPDRCLHARGHSAAEAAGERHPELAVAAREVRRASLPDDGGVARLCLCHIDEGARVPGGDQ